MVHENLGQFPKNHHILKKQFMKSSRSLEDLDKFLSF
jgi:hypothetical protein